MSKLVGEYFKDRREALGLTQTDMAKRFGLKEPSLIARWESGQEFPTASLFSKVLEAYQISAEEWDSILDSERSDDSGSQQSDFLIRLLKNRKLI